MQSLSLSLPPPPSFLVNHNHYLLGKKVILWFVYLSVFLLATFLKRNGLQWNRWGHLISMLSIGASRTSRKKYHHTSAMIFFFCIGQWLWPPMEGPNTVTPYLHDRDYPCLSLYHYIYIPCLYEREFSLYSTAFIKGTIGAPINM